MNQALQQFEHMIQDLNHNKSVVSMEDLQTLGSFFLGLGTVFAGLGVLLAGIGVYTKFSRESK
ncbi:hypothetical protein [Bacillus multifaciens]|uniref:hypothetical protein n=1 Tax=Bacillus multifaciens TaxID=3068506 RepID=UPI0027406E47|nr:hypothetical protein [Bacillus sp. WLY-B-L8]MDP7978553.1 hypothetical protein [Bacillus sp. WLY-B-L8]